MVAFSRRYFEIHYFLVSNHVILFQISRKFVPRGPVQNNPASVQIMEYVRLDLDRITSGNEW